MRRTEDTSYALWSTVLHNLYLKYTDVFISCPQYNIYTSPKLTSALQTPTNPDDSIITMSDGKAMGVYVDLAVLKPHINHKTSDRVEDFLKSLSLTNLPYRDVEMSGESEAVILVELKRPPTRHPKNIGSFLIKIDDTLQKAQVQAARQAHCLMCCPKFAGQDSVILIAGAGDWWTCIVWTRADSMNLPPLTDDSLQRMKDDDDDDDDDSIVDCFNVLKPPEQVRSRQGALDKAMEEEEERARRRARRQLVADAGEIAEQISQTAVYPYSDDEINKYWAHAMGPGTFLESEDITSISGHWTLPIRLGTVVSAKVLGLIEERLKGMAQAERNRRARVNDKNDVTGRTRAGISGSRVYETRGQNRKTVDSQDNKTRKRQGGR